MFVKLWLPVNIYNRIQRKRDVIRLIDSTMAHNDGLKEPNMKKLDEAMEAIRDLKG